MEYHSDGASRNLVPASRWISYTKKVAQVWYLLHKYSTTGTKGIKYRPAPFLELNSKNIDLRRFWIWIPKIWTCAGFGFGLKNIDLRPLEGWNLETVDPKCSIRAYVTILPNGFWVWDLKFNSFFMKILLSLLWLLQGSSNPPKDFWVWNWMFFI